MAGQSRSRALGAWERLQLRRCLGGAQLSCGCIVGVYETRAGGTMVVIDSPASRCQDEQHRAGVVITEPASEDLDGERATTAPWGKA